MGITEATPTERKGAPRVYFGWIVAIASGSILAVAYGAQFGFGVILPHMEETTSWSRGQLSVAYSVYVVVYSCLSYPAGRLTDRYGPQTILLIGGLLLALGYAGVAASRELWHVYVSLGLVAGIGMSATFVPCNSTVVRWFAVHRGKASSISTAGVGVGGLVAPPVAGALAAALGWRPAYALLAVFVGLWLVVASRVMFASPESRGLHVDGHAPLPRPEGPVEAVSHSPTAAASGSPRDFTVGEAVRTAEFWLIAMIFTLTFLVVFFPIVHLAAFAESVGMSRTNASWAVAAIGFGGLFGRATSGAISDRAGRLTMMSTVLLAEVAAFIVFARTSEPAVVLGAAVVFGYGYGGTTALFPAVVGDAFGRTHIGSLVGLIFAGAGSAAAIGPTYAGYLHTVTGSYRSAFMLSALANAVALLLVGVLGLRRQRFAAAQHRREHRTDLDYAPASPLPTGRSDRTSR